VYHNFSPTVEDLTVALSDPSFTAFYQQLLLAFLVDPSSISIGPATSSINVINIGPATVIDITKAPTSTPTAAPTWSLSPTRIPTIGVGALTALVVIIDTVVFNSYTLFFSKLPTGQKEIIVTDCNVAVSSCIDPNTGLALNGFSSKVDPAPRYISMAASLTAIVLLDTDGYLYLLLGQFVDNNGQSYDFSSDYQALHRSAIAYPGVSSIAFLQNGDIAVNVDNSNPPVTNPTGLPPWFRLVLSNTFIL
jgi:hypothetical protein